MSTETQNKPDSTNLEEQIETLSHEDLMEISQSALKRIIATDSLLSDLPGDVTVDEVLAQIAVAHGQSITVTLLRYTEKPLSVVIPQQGTTVRDLKRTVQRTFNLKQQRLKSKTKISWRCVWRTYQLQCDGHVMNDDKELVVNYGVRNKSEIRFVKKLRKTR